MKRKSLRPISKNRERILRSFIFSSEEKCNCVKHNECRVWTLQECHEEFMKKLNEERKK